MAVLIMFGTTLARTSAIFGKAGMIIVVAIILASSVVSGDTVVDLLLGDSSIGQSDIRLRGKLVGSIIGVDSKATTYDIACDTTGTIAFPFTTPACVGGEHVTITQGSSTMFLSQVFITESTSQNFQEGCTFSNTDTVTCSLTNAISEILVVGGQTTTTTYTETSSGVNASPTNGPLYFDVTITAGLNKLSAFHTTATTTPAGSGSSSSSTASPTSGSHQVTIQGKLVLYLAFFTAGYLGF